MIRRLAFRNQKNLFIRKDDASGKDIFSGIPQSAPIKVYDLEYWNSDNWDPMEFGKDYDFSRPFFEQFRELMQSVPWPSKSVQFMVNSDYCDQAGYMKNCYLCFDADHNEDCAYCVRFHYTKNSFDISESVGNELCYDSFSINKCYKTFFSIHCENCIDVWFSKDLTGCNNCFGCVGLRNKSFYIFNKPYSKEEYFKKLEEFDLKSRDSLEKYLEKAQEFWTKSPNKYMHGSHNNDVSGDYIFNSRNSWNSYDINGAENVKHSLTLMFEAKDSYDYSIWGTKSSRMYECVTCGDQDYNLRFCWECWPGCRDLEYSMECRSSSDLFGCIGLKKKSYCILNKQYSKEDYFAFSILKEIIKCVECGKAYRIISMELDFLRKMNLSLLVRCQNCRYEARIKYRNQPKLYERQCQCAGKKSENGVYPNVAGHKHGAGHCPNEFETSYSPERPDIVYCEDCYLQEVV